MPRCSFPVSADFRRTLTTRVPSGLRVPLTDRGSISSGNRDLWVNVSLMLPSSKTWRMEMKSQTRDWPAGNEKEERAQKSEKSNKAREGAGVQKEGEKQWKRWRQGVLHCSAGEEQAGGNRGRGKWALTAALWRCFFTVIGLRGRLNACGFLPICLLNPVKMIFLDCSEGSSHFSFCSLTF